MSSIFKLSLRTIFHTCTPASETTILNSRAPTIFTQRSRSALDLHIQHIQPIYWLFIVGGIASSYIYQLVSNILFASPQRLSILHCKVCPCAGRRDHTLTGSGSRPPTVRPPCLFCGLGRRGEARAQLSIMKLIVAFDSGESFQVLLYFCAPNFTFSKRNISSHSSANDSN